MKVLLILFCASAVALAKDTITSEDIKNHPVIGYHTKVGTNLAHRVKEREDRIVYHPSRIAGGSVISSARVPYQAGIVISLETDAVSICGGALVTNRHVVTAAHCWWDGSTIAKTFEIVLGSDLLFYGGTRLIASRVVMHINWLELDLSFNIALATIPFVQFSDTIQAIALPIYEEEFTGLTAVASGYGLTSNSDTLTTAQTLQAVNVTVITNLECSIFYGQYVTDNIICTSGVGNVGTCAGDYGGPVVAEYGGERFLVGIGAYGPESCGTGLPSAYLRISNFAPWIRINTEE